MVEHVPGLHDIGTGIGGRVTRKDVQSHIDGRDQGTALQTPTLPDDDEERVPLAPVRRMIAENMARSASAIPEAWMLVEADVSDLVRLREEQKADWEQRELISDHRREESLRLFQVGHGRFTDVGRRGGLEDQFR